MLPDGLIEVRSALLSQKLLVLVKVWLVESDYGLAGLVKSELLRLLLFQRLFLIGLVSAIVVVVVAEVELI